MRHVRQPGCSFCEADIERAVFAERGDFRALHNASPILPGHSLIIPRWHVPRLLELSDGEVADMMLFSRVVVRNLTTLFGGQGFNWTIQEGAVAGQTVPHLHLHLIPRSDGDLPDPGDWYPRLQESEAKQIDSEDRSKLAPDEMATIVGRIRQMWTD